MTQATRCTSSGFTHSAFSATSARKIMQGVLAIMLVFVLLGNVAIAQNEDEPVRIIPKIHAVNAQDAGDSSAPQQPAAAQPAPQSQPAPAQNQAVDSTFVLPPGTSLPVGLTRPMALKSSSAKGAGVYLQVTFPVTVGGRMAVPPGAYVQGTIEKMRTNRGANPDLEFEMRSASLIFSTGYTVPLTGTVHMVHNNARLMPPDPGPNSQQPADAFLPGPVPKPSPALSAAGTTPTLPPLPSLGNGPRNAIIAIGAIGGAVLVGGIVFALHHRNDVYLETGTPLEIILAEPLKLDANSVSMAVQQYSAQMATAPPEIVQPPKRPQICYDPGTPGTPNTVIPGSPGTPPTVIPGVNGAPDTVIPGTPATPDTVIPGTPGTPSNSYPCPK
jgi:hypothetical protein